MPRKLIDMVLLVESLEIGVLSVPRLLWVFLVTLMLSIYFKGKEGELIPRCAGTSERTAIASGSGRKSHVEEVLVK
jgi:hypothetical protein